MRQGKVVISFDVTGKASSKRIERALEKWCKGEDIGVTVPAPMGIPAHTTLRDVKVVVR